MIGPNHEDRDIHWWDVALVVLDGFDLFVWLILVLGRALLRVIGLLATALII